MTFGPTKLPFKANDGKFHTWRIDWHTGDPEGTTGKVIEPRVDFFLDGELIRTITTTVPVDAGHFWIGLWFPNKWAGEPDFDVDTLEIDWVRITPFHEPRDRHKYSQPGPGRFLLGPEYWPERLYPVGKKGLPTRWCSQSPTAFGFRGLLTTDVRPQQKNQSNKSSPLDFLTALSLNYLAIFPDQPSEHARTAFGMTKPHSHEPFAISLHAFTAPRRAMRALPSRRRLWRRSARRILQSRCGRCHPHCRRSRA